MQKNYPLANNKPWIRQDWI